MRAYSIRVLIAAAGLAAVVSCGSVASHSTGADGSNGGQGGLAGGGGGGATGQGGAAGATDGGAGGTAPPAGISVRGGFSPLGPLPAPAGSMQVMRARLEPSPICSGNICVSGGLVP